MANRLIHEQSPYLLQHAHNPVDWYPWGDEAFARAREEHKPVLVSIGYAACHWCHVMEHESFEHEDVAAYMNAHFVNIKVDREEHPDVDHLYMDAVQAISGSGGWPLNVFVTPDRIPFFGGTYYPPRPAFNRPSWIQLLQRMHQVWSERQDEVTAQGRQMVQHLQQASNIGFKAPAGSWDMDTCRQMADALLQQADKEYGGFGRAPKFPGTMAISFLLEHYHFTGYQPAKEQALHSLDAMINGGIYDQLGGGFARYSTDEKWLAPHFEKMLYDNALLVSTLCDAWYLTKKQRYKEVIHETIAFVQRELRDPPGGYYCALDADSEGVEGKFYTWTWDEWKEVVNGSDDLEEKYFGVQQEGNWEHTNILHVNVSTQALADEYGCSEKEVEQRLSETKGKLLAAREKRLRPLTDDKCLLSWNALMNMALVKAAAALQSDDYLHEARAHMHWMLQAFATAEGALLHTWKNGQARISANLDDYAYLVQALLQLANAASEPQWLLRASALMNVVQQQFQHENGNFFYYSSSAQQDIPVRKVELYDGALPSANAVMAHNMLLLGICMDKPAINEQAYYMLRQMADTAGRYTYSFAYWAMLLQRYVQELQIVICQGAQAAIVLKGLQQYFIPQIYCITSKKEISDVPIAKDKKFTMKEVIFVCTQHACKPPVADLASVLNLLGL